VDAVAADRTVVPVDQLLAPSSLYWVLARPPDIPEPPPSLGVSMTGIEETVCQPTGALSVVAGAVVSSAITSLSSSR